MTALATPTQTLDTRLERFERFLNKVGYIPLVSSFSGGVRIYYGIIESICAVVIGALKFIASLFRSDTNERYILETEAAYSLYYVEHGLANIGRGIVESIPFVNLFCIAYDHFASRFSYIDVIV